MYARILLADCPKCRKPLQQDTEAGRVVSPEYCPRCLVDTEESEWCPKCRDFYEPTEESSACPSCVAQKDADISSNRSCQDGLIRAMQAA